MMTLKEYEQMRKQTDEEVAVHQVAETSKAKHHYEGSAEGQFHYATVEDED